MKIQVSAGVSVCVALLFCLAAHAEQDVFGPQEFKTRVRGAGGRVDLVVGADRPFQECHASCVLDAGGGALLATWFGGTEEKNPDVAIWLSHFLNGKWSAPQRIAKINETAHWNPVLFRDAEGIVYCFFKVGPEIPMWQTYWMRSQDRGNSWSTPKELVAGDHGGRGPVRSKPLLLADGTWLAPASTELKGWNAFADRSRDRGVTWERTPDFAQDGSTAMRGGAIQPTLWESPPGAVHALMRSRMGRILRSDSIDGGKTWSPMRATELPNNNSGVDVARIADGRLILAYNPVSQNWGGRSPLSLAISADNGATWRQFANVEDEPKAEFSYPSLALTKDGIVLTYTWKRERIRAWQIPAAALP